MCVNKNIIQHDSEHIIYITNSSVGRHNYSGVVSNYDIRLGLAWLSRISMFASNPTKHQHLF